MSKLQTTAALGLIFVLICALAAFKTPPRSGSGGGLTGVQEFIQSGSFTVPSGVTHVRVTLWGGGGGGAGFTCNYGGGGGGGAYTDTVVPVTEGLTYTVTVGVGGAGSQGFSGADGGNGNDSEFAVNGTVLVFAGGGEGGKTPVNCLNGVNGAGGRADENAQISHAGGIGGHLGESYPGVAYSLPYAMNSHWGIGQGGLGGGDVSNYNGITGGPGYVFLTF